MEECDFEEYRARSIIKAVTYRVVIVILDLTVVYFLTGRLEIAVGFAIASNIYTSVVYYFHERLWNSVKWGKKPKTE